MGKKAEGRERERDRAATRSRHLLVAAESTYGGSFGWDSCAVVVLAVASSCWMMMMQMIYGAHTMIAWAMSDSHAPLSLLFRATVFFFLFLLVVVPSFLLLKIFSKIYGSSFFFSFVFLSFLFFYLLYVSLFWWLLLLLLYLWLGGPLSVHAAAKNPPSK